jgi:hypothetical protein
MGQAESFGMSRSWRTPAWVLLVLLLSAATPALAGEELVLIVAADSKIDKLDSSAVRKLFLGLMTQRRGDRLRPLLNESDAQLKEIFLQNIVSMSDSTYDRHVVQLSLEQGRKQPKVYQSTAQLISSVAADPMAVSYAWLRDVEHDRRVRVLRTLWHD